METFWPDVIPEEKKPLEDPHDTDVDYDDNEEDEYTAVYHGVP